VLKITTTEQSESLTLVLEGRLCRPWTGEVEGRWLDLLASAVEKEKEVLLDLAGVTFVDRDGEALLGSILEGGASVRASGVLVSYIVRQVQRRIATKSTALPEARQDRVAAPACTSTPPSPKCKGPLGNS
jgi:ABC-type transporter Mla MlaB component